MQLSDSLCTIWLPYCLGLSAILSADLQLLPLIECIGSHLFPLSSSFNSPALRPRPRTGTTIARPSLLPAPTVKVSALTMWVISGLNLQARRIPDYAYPECYHLRAKSRFRSTMALIVWAYYSPLGKQGASHAGTGMCGTYVPSARTTV